MKTLIKFTTIFVLISAGSLSFLSLPILAEENFDIKAVKFRIYDNEKNTLLDQETNPYGNGMELLLSVQLSQDADKENVYTITVEGFGKGRENEAEGTVEDYKIKETKEIKLYTRDPIYVPFILEFPCTEKTDYTVTVERKSTGKKLTKTLKSPFSFCYFN